jgi:hypothetical protein
MKNLGIFEKRFLSICMGISAILLSGSMLAFSLKSFNKPESILTEKVLKAGSTGNLIAKTMMRTDSVRSASSTEDVQAIQAFGIGIRDGILYFGILYNNNTIGLHKTESGSEDILHW